MTTQINVTGVEKDCPIVTLNKGNNMNLNCQGSQFISMGGAVDGFSSFLSDVLANNNNGNYLIPDREAFLNAGSYYNPIKKLATVVRSNADVVEMPAFNPESGWDDDVSSKKEEGHNVIIKLYHAYAKFMVSCNMFGKIIACDSYLKNILSIKLAALEKSAIFHGSGEKSPKGIISQYFDHCREIRKLKDKNYDGEIEEDNEFQAKDNLHDTLIEMLSKLNSAYYGNATFIISSKVYGKLLEKSHSDKAFQQLKELYGCNFVVMDEIIMNKKEDDSTYLNDYIILADFKQAVAIVEGTENMIKAHSEYSRPNMIGLSMPVSIGVGILNYDAIVCRRVV